MKKLLVLVGLLAVGCADRRIEPRVVELKILHKDTAGDPNESRRKASLEDFRGGATCSGAFISNNGDILTAAHCLRDAEEVWVRTSDNQVYEATSFSTSPTHDLGLIHIARTGSRFFPLASEVVRGEKVSILGSPLGITNSLSTGIIAKLDGDRTLLDCGALPGNSGSTVYNTKGELVGVLVAGYMVGLGTTHLNVAQSVDSVRYFLKRAGL